VSEANTVSLGDEKRLDPASINASRLTAGIWVVILAVATMTSLIVSIVAGQPSRGTILLLVGAWLLALAALSILALRWPVWSFRRTSYRLDATGIRIRRGVIWRSEVTVPRSRVQHTDVSRGPIERSFGLATLVVHTAGTEHASVSLGGLTAADSYPIRDYLIAGGDGDDAV